MRAAQTSHVNQDGRKYNARAVHGEPNKCTSDLDDGWGLRGALCCPMQHIDIAGDLIACSGNLLLPTICSDSDESGSYNAIGLKFHEAFGAFRLLATLQAGATPCRQFGGQPLIEWEMDFAPSAPDCRFLDAFGIPQPRLLTWITNGALTTERCETPCEAWVYGFAGAVCTGARSTAIRTEVGRRTPDTVTGRSK